MACGCPDLRERGGLPLIDISPSDIDETAVTSSPGVTASAPSATDEAAPGGCPPPDPGQLFPPDVPRTSPRRLICRNASFVIGKKDGDLETGIEAFAGHKITANLGYTEQAELIEIGFVEAGKAGHGIQLLLAELGLRLSRVIQGRDPSDDAHQMPVAEVA